MNPMNIHFEYNILYFHSKIIKKKSILAQKEDKLIVGGLERPSYAKISSTKSMEPVKKIFMEGHANGKKKLIGINKDGSKLRQ